MFLGSLACNKLLRHYLFLMTLIILRSTAQLFCMILEFVWCFSHHSGFEGRNTTEVKSRFHPITLRVHAASMIYCCCCWPWPAGWSRFIISFLNCEVTLFFPPLLVVLSLCQPTLQECPWGAHEGRAGGMSSFLPLMWFFLSLRESLCLCDAGNRRLPPGVPCTSGCPSGVLCLCIVPHPGLRDPQASVCSLSPGHPCVSLRD